MREKFNHLYLNTAEIKKTAEMLFSADNAPKNALCAD